MIKAVAQSPLGHVVALGLSKENVNRMLAGQPVRVTGESVGLGNVAAILIFYGETEAHMEKELRDAGLIGPNTRTETPSDAL